MRIVGGSARGRNLRSVPGNETRPTSDRVRQSLFDLLGQRCDGLRVLDLYAGTGALGLEALSRGAAHATFIESAKAAAEVIEANLRDLGFEPQGTLVRRDVDRALADLGARKAAFDLIFADPPYALAVSQKIAAAVAAHGLLAEEGRIVIERGKREAPPTPPDGFALLDDRAYGETILAVLAKTRPAAASD